MQTIKLELSVKLLLGAIALGLLLNAFNLFPPKKVTICGENGSQCAVVTGSGSFDYLGVSVLNN